jgi:hypothetical protein
MVKEKLMKIGQCCSNWRKIQPVALAEEQG